MLELLNELVVLKCTPPIYTGDYRILELSKYQRCLGVIEHNDQRLLIVRHDGEINLIVYTPKITTFEA